MKAKRLAERASEQKAPEAAVLLPRLNAAFAWTFWAARETCHQARGRTARPHGSQLPDFASPVRN